MVASSVIVNDLIHVLPNPNAMTIKPRLEYGVYIVRRILEKLNVEYERILGSNLEFYSQNSEAATQNHDFKKQTKFEAVVLRAIEALKIVENRLTSISQLSNVTEILPLVTLVRTVNSSIYPIMPSISWDFVELSGILGSMATDSGSLVEATFDFKQTNLESNRILAKVNLIVDSKLNKQYPNLNF